jgi:hypothetical protein
MHALLSARQRSSPEGSGDNDPRKQHKLPISVSTPAARARPRTPQSAERPSPEQ